MPKGTSIPCTPAALEVGGLDVTGGGALRGYLAIGGGGGEHFGGMVACGGAHLIWQGRS